MNPPLSRTGKTAIAAIVVAGVALLGAILWIARDRPPQTDPGAATTVAEPAATPAVPKLAPTLVPVAPAPAPEPAKAVPSPVSPPSGTATEAAPAQPFAGPRPLVRGLRALGSMIKASADGGGQVSR